MTALRVAGLILAAWAALGVLLAAAWWLFRRAGWKGPRP